MQFWAQKGPGGLPKDPGLDYVSLGPSFCERYVLGSSVFWHVRGDAVKEALGVPVEPPDTFVCSKCGPVWRPVGGPKCTQRAFPGAAEALLGSTWGAA